MGAIRVQQDLRDLATRACDSLALWDVFII